MVTVVITTSCDPLVLLHTIIQHIHMFHMPLFPHTSLCVPARWCRGDLHRCLCEGTQWTHLWCNIDQGILNCLLILDSIDLHPFHLFQRDSDPKEIFLNLYGIHCDPNAFFQWEKIAGASTILLSIYSTVVDCTVLLLSRGLATTELKIHPIPAHTHAVSSLISLLVWSYPSFLIFLATEFLLKVSGRQCFSCREMTSKCTCTEKNGDSQRYVCVHGRNTSLTVTPSFYM